MYRNPYKAISEIIINSYDADATEVVINTFFDEAEPRIIISDNGNGMSEEEIKEYYLYLGYNGRKVFGEETKRGRKRIGNKGIGKLAGLGIAEKMIVEMIKNKIISTFELDLAKLMKIDDLKSKDIKISIDDTNQNDGCSITLTKLTNRGKKISPKKLREYLATNFTPQDEFIIIVDGEPCSREQLIAEKFEIDERIPGLGSTNGYIAYLDKVPIEPGIKIKVFNRTVTSPKLYGYHRQSAGYFTATHMYGEINADFLDEAINTSRDGFDSENEKWKQYVEWVEDELSRRVDIIRNKNKKKRRSKFRKFPKVKERLETLPPETRKMLEENIDKFLDAFEDMDEDTAYELTELIIKFFEGARLREIFKEILSLDVTDTEKFSILLKEYGFQTILDYVEGIKEWLGIIRKFQEFINSEKAKEIEIHKIMVDNLWIIDEELHLKGSNTTIRRLLDILVKSDSQKLIFLEEMGNKRPDVVASNEGLITLSGVPTRKLKVIELKKPTVKIGHDQIRQTKDYLFALKKNLGGDYEQYKAYLIGGILDKNVDQAIENSDIFEIILFNQLLDRCERRYHFLLEKFEGLAV